MKNIIIYLRVILLMTMCINVLGCKKLLEIDPPVDKRLGSEIFKNPSLAISAMTGVYLEIGQISESMLVGNGQISFNLGFMSDELAMGSLATDSRIYRNEFHNVPWDLWSKSYKNLIYRINAIIDGVSKSETIDDRTKNYLVGEAKFSRAFIYFYLVNLYGDLPLITTPYFNNNINIARSPVNNVYDQIVKDLRDSQSLLT
ncbi:MAG: RagB/SusD family nutrient uptake outer membrane protein, partial [Janthinobacterium sp.]